ncbi:MAG: hypothetical protein MJZ16_05225 [Bacteroidales bacterium]|nr:hypothetical protein [Bacteroidales bacterium]
MKNLIHTVAELTSAENNSSIRFCETKYIKNKTREISDERLSFMDGERLGDVSIRIEDGATKRKIRRIVEKRVSQNYYKAHPHAKCNARFATKRHLANTLKNIYGEVTVGFSYCCKAA